MKSMVYAAVSALTLAGCASADLTSTPVVQSSDGQSRQAEIMNDTPITMVRLRAQNSETLTWSGNLLSNRISKNRSQIVLIDDGTSQCLYNFQATMSDGAKITRRELDVCTLASWRIFRR